MSVYLSANDGSKLMRIARLVSLILLPLLGTALPAFGQTRILRLEVVVGADEELGLEQEIMTNLEKVGADHLKISKAVDPPLPKVEEIVNGQVVSVRITAVAQGRNIFFSTAKFSRNDIAGISDYLKKIRDDGSKVALAEKKAFGLTSEQLVALSEDLGQPYAESTVDASVESVVNKISAAIKAPVMMDPELKQSLAAGGPVRDELKGLAYGTVLAASLRPLGLVVVPSRIQGKPIELKIIPGKSATEFWPVGWPHEGNLSEIAPKLYERLDINIRDFVLADAISALQKRMGLPILLDYNSLAEKEVDLQTAIVTYERKKSPHFMTLDKLLGQTKPALKVEVRIDEAGQPFLWIF
jgi:hypothetical protein